jgi:uncharacterized protein (TIRG00374 family)
VTSFVPRTTAGRLALVVPVGVGLLALAVWRGPDLGVVGDAFGAVEWRWVAAAVAINFLSIVARAVAWKVVIDEAVPEPHPRRRNVFAAFSIGLLANAALPGRVGELARVMVLARRMPRFRGSWATLTGTVFAHRLFDVVVAVVLVVIVLYTARIPLWAKPGLAVAIGIGVGLLIAALVLARRDPKLGTEGLGRIRRMLRMARSGLTVLHRPAPAVAALVFQVLGWVAQLFAVWTTFRAFGIDGSLPMAALVLLLMNLVMVFPLWPGNIGLVQAALALSLLPYGVGYAHGLAFGIGLQAIEASVGIALGLLFLAREGFSFAMLKRMPEVTGAELDERVERIA